MAGSWRRVLESSNKARVVKELARRCEGSDYSAMSERKNTAVLVPLVMGQQDPEVLFTVRSRGLRQHRGQVSFPGGGAEPGDVSLVDTALRETQEELGIPRTAVDVWGVLPALPDRVEFTFTLPLSHLAQPNVRRHTRFRTASYEFPVYIGGPRRIWGITAFILDYVLPLIIPHNLLRNQS